MPKKNYPAKYLYSDTSHCPKIQTCKRQENFSGSIADPGWGTGGLDPPENYKNKGFLSNTGSDLLKIHKATKQAFNHWPASKTTCKWRFAGGSMMAGF